MVYLSQRNRTKLLNNLKKIEKIISSEDVISAQDLFLDNPFKIENGCVTVTDKPGWGIDINPEWLNNSDYQVSDIN